ncbi:hypothetical protein BLOT_007395 [Blomia tropicalis]|nr:hypothetical protein BLOT_007395 [Blomia tropicalis]
MVNELSWLMEPTNNLAQMLRSIVTLSLWRCPSVFLMVASQSTHGSVTLMVIVICFSASSTFRLGTFACWNGKSENLCLKDKVIERMIEQPIGKFEHLAKKKPENNAS